MFSIFLGLFSLSLGLLLLSYIESKTIIAVLLIAATTAGSSVTCGHLVNHIDLSPRYAGILSGISNGIGQIIAIFAPILVHFIVTDEVRIIVYEYKTKYLYKFDFRLINLYGDLRLY